MRGSVPPLKRSSRRTGHFRTLSAVDEAAGRAAAPDSPVYDLDIVNSPTTYQFTRAFALRGIAQYDSSRKRVLTDFLSSYEPRPGTVVCAGYGSLLEQREFADAVWVPGVGEYRTTH